MRPTSAFAILAAALATGCGSSSGGGPAVDASTDGAPSSADGAPASGDATTDADATGDAAPDGEATDAAAPRADAALDGATGSGGDGGECALAADCHLFSACDSCTCLAQTGSGPVCTGVPVECLVAPCGSKTAACNQGHCVVEP